jgi:hypothetical protein
MQTHSSLLSNNLLHAHQHDGRSSIFSGCSFLHQREKRSPCYAEKTLSILIVIPFPAIDIISV